MYIAIISIGWLSRDRGLFWTMHILYTFIGKILTKALDLYFVFPMLLREWVLEYICICFGFQDFQVSGKCFRLIFVLQKLYSCRA